MRALQQKAEEVGVAQDQIDEADDSKEDLIDLILAASAKEDPPGVAAEVRTSNKKSKNLATCAVLRAQAALLITPRASVDQNCIWTLRHRHRRACH